MDASDMACHTHRMQGRSPNRWRPLKVGLLVVLVWEAQWALPPVQWLDEALKWMCMRSADALGVLDHEAGGGAVFLLDERFPNRPYIAYQVSAIIARLASHMPLTLLLLMGLSLTRWSGFPDRETRCRHCGHILRGITAPRCPECGTAI